LADPYNLRDPDAFILDFVLNTVAMTKNGLGELVIINFIDSYRESHVLTWMQDHTSNLKPRHFRRVSSLNILAQDPPVSRITSRYATFNRPSVASTPGMTVTWPLKNSRYSFPGERPVSLRTLSLQA
jgi:hypothetical protein